MQFHHQLRANPQMVQQIHAQRGTRIHWQALGRRQQDKLFRRTSSRFFLCLQLEGVILQDKP